MKRVCIVRHNYYPDEAHVRRDAETLLHHGYEVDVICLKRREQKSQETFRGIRVYRLPVEHHRRGILRYIFEYFAFFFLTSWKLTWLYLKKKYDVVEVDNLPDFLVFVTIFPKLLGAKVIFYVFDNMPDVFVDNFMISPDHVWIRLLRFVEKASTGWADHVIATQSHCKELLQSRGVSGSKISVVLNVPDESVFNHFSSPNSNDSHFRLITHGSLLERYNIQTLIRAVPLLKGDIPDLKVIIAGDGEYRSGLEDLAQSMGVKQYVDFTGWLPVEKVHSQIAQSHIGVVVIPAGVNPSMPNKLFEYLALGRPTVITSVPAIKAYLDDSSAMFYEPDNERDLARCILELYRNPEKRAALAAASSAIYQKYRWSVMKYEYLKVFDTMTKSRTLSQLEKDRNVQSQD